jgi:pimeloyl-ACP methyl ester carboxylesterase
MDLERPRLEGSLAVRGGRRLTFAEYGAPRGEAIIWMHGTPGGRRQVPVEARNYALQHDLRIIGLDRPGIGSSTPHLYDNIVDWTGDLEIVAERLSIDTMRLVGLSGGGPYTLAAAAAMPDRVHGVGVLGGVPPTQGDDAVKGGLVGFSGFFAPMLTHGYVPLGLGLGKVIQLLRPLAGAAIGAYAAVQPQGDKELLNHPEFKAMFLDDLVGGSRKQAIAPLADLVLFSRHWGFELGDVEVPVRWWHGDEDPIVPLSHGQQAAEKLPQAEFIVNAGHSHLGGLGISVEVLSTLMELGPAAPA